MKQKALTGPPTALVLVCNSKHVSLLENELLVRGVSLEIVQDDGLLVLLFLLIAKTSLEIRFFLPEIIHFAQESFDLGTSLRKLSAKPANFRVVSS